MNNGQSPFWSIPSVKLLQQLQTSLRGLMSDEAKLRLLRYGANLLKPKKKSDSPTLLLSQFKSPIILILIFAAGLSFFLHDSTNAAILSGLSMRPTPSSLSVRLAPKENIMDDVKRILVVSRSTKYCHKAIHYGVSLAKQCGAQLYIIHVIDDPFSPEKWYHPFPYPYPELLQEDYKKMQQEVKKDLDEMIALEKAQGMLIEEFLRDGNPADEILKVAQDEKIDLIVMLAHEEDRLEHLFLGHDNAKLIRKMPCSILLVKHELF